MSDEEQKELKNFLLTIDKSNFSVKPFVRIVEKPWGHEVHFTPPDFPYTGKLLHIDEDKRMSLQMHDEKHESWFLKSGSILLNLENSDGKMEEFEMKPDQGYACAAGQKHRLVGGKGGGVVFEVSLPEYGNTFRLEDDYGRNTETEAARLQRNREARTND